ncbi:hypothetical protein [Microvirga sp. Mcv34]|uniref:hypothetical protein n=1 Tax=Microvirga sp. Mcv34 TaxID=2926016 RepID=UPI0021C99692|nr:hypothetical protein [Microvirga sp. Mcv34]
MPRLSTLLCRTLVVPSKAPADAKTIALLVAALGHAAALPQPEGYGPVDRDMDLQLAALLQEVTFRPVELPMASLLGSMGLSRRELAKVHARAQAMEPHGPEQPPRPAFNATMADGDGVIGLEVEETLALMAASMGEDEGIEVSMADIMALRSRYAAVLYMRCLAWLAAPTALPRAWKARHGAKGALFLELPADRMQELLGTSGMRDASDVERVLLRPAAESLGAVGIDFTWEIVRYPNGKPRWLRVRILQAARRPLDVVQESANPVAGPQPVGTLAALKLASQGPRRGGKARKPRQPRKWRKRRSAWIRQDDVPEAALEAHAREG